MIVCVIGHMGNMGRRYSSILDYLEVDWVGCEEGHPVPPFATHYIIATPTDTHAEMINLIGREPNSNKRILVEKPVCVMTSIHPPKELAAIQAARAQGRGNSVYMVNQYAYYPGVDVINGITSYDFYNSGNDGIGWDCIQLLHLARGRVFLKNESPIWKAKINGIILDRDLVDQCYVDMIKDFVGPRKNLWGWHNIKEAHEKAYKWTKENTDRRTGQVNVKAVAR